MQGAANMLAASKAVVKMTRSSLLLRLILADLTPCTMQVAAEEIIMTVSHGFRQVPCLNHF